VALKKFLIKLQQNGRRYSTIKTVRGVLRSAFQMAVDDDVLRKNPFGFELATVVVNDSVTREAITRKQMRQFLKFVHPCFKKVCEQWCGVDGLKMSDYGIRPDEFMTLAQNARATMGGLFYCDRVPLSDEECAAIFEKSYC
jgi:hypothetical protein